MGSSLDIQEKDKHTEAIIAAAVASKCGRSEEMSGRAGGVLPVLFLSLCLSAGSVRGQGASQDSFIIQYMERRLVQLEVSASCIQPSNAVTAVMCMT